MPFIMCYMRVPACISLIRCDNATVDSPLMVSPMHVLCVFTCDTMCSALVVCVVLWELSKTIKLKKNIVQLI